MIKVRVKESLGVNTEMVLCADTDCVAESRQVGTTEILLALIEKDVQYTLTMSYAHSIIEMANFFECPSHHIEVVVIPVTEYNPADENSKDMEANHESRLTQIFHNITDITER